MKIALSRYVKRTGLRVKSTSLVAAGTDAGYDAIISASVLASAIFFNITGISLEAWLGLLIALFIIRSGIELITETLNDILGKRTDAALSKDIKTAIKEEPQVMGAYDLYIFNYGPGLDYATVQCSMSGACLWRPSPSPWACASSTGSPTATPPSTNAAPATNSSRNRWFAIP